MEPCLLYVSASLYFWGFELFFFNIMCVKVICIYFAYLFSLLYSIP